MEPGLIRNVLWSFFREYVEDIEDSNKRDENDNCDNMESIEYLLNAEKTKKKIEKISGLNDDLLTGLFMYLDEVDSYFNQRLNTQDLFFQKIMFNKNKLEKIGKKIVKPIFPFDSFENYDKKIVLLR